MAEKVKFELKAKDKDAIRKAYTKRQKTITIQGHVFMIRKFVHTVRFVSGEEVRKSKEAWLFINRKDGGLVPCASIEYPHAMANLRSKFGKREEA